MTETVSPTFGFGMEADLLRRHLQGLEVGSDGPVPRLRRLARRGYGAAVRRALPVVEWLRPSGRVRCVICSWTGVEFRPLVYPGWMQRNAKCPSCGSVQRHRLVALALSAHKRQASSVLWIAPERSLESVLVDALGSVVTLDLEMDGVDVRADVEALPFPTDRLDAVVSSDVLEHVVDDRRALVELRRVVREDGMVLLHVPVLWTETVEYGFANPYEFGHRRGYGPDIVERLETAGFVVAPFVAKRWSRRECRELGLLEWDVVFVARPAQPGQAGSGAATAVRTTPQR